MGYGCPTASPSPRRGHPPPSRAGTWFIRYVNKEPSRRRGWVAPLEATAVLRPAQASRGATRPLPVVLPGSSVTSKKSRQSRTGGWPLWRLRLSYGQPKPPEGPPAPFPWWYLVRPLHQRRAVKAARAGGPSGGYGCPTASPSLQKGHPPPSRGRYSSGVTTAKEVVKPSKLSGKVRGRPRGARSAES